MRYAIVDSNNIVINTIIYESGNWKPPQGCIMVKSPRGGIGDIYNPQDGSFTTPIQPVLGGTNE